MKRVRAVRGDGAIALEEFDDQGWRAIVSWPECVHEKVLYWSRRSRCAVIHDVEPGVNLQVSRDFFSVCRGDYRWKGWSEADGWHAVREMLEGV